MTLFEKLNEVQVDVNEGLGKSLQRKIGSARTSQGGRAIMRPALAFTVLALSVLVVNQGLRYEQGKDISFIERALAVSYERDRLLDKDSVRHLVTATSSAGEFEVQYEFWIDGNGSVFTEKAMDLKNDMLISEVITRGNASFYSPKMVELMRQEEEVQAQYREEDYQIFPVRIEMPEGWMGGSGMGAVPGGWQACLDAEEPATSQQEEGADLMMGVEQALGFSELNTTLPNIPKALELLANSDLAKDVGEQEDELLGKVHIYRITIPQGWSGSGRERSGADYVFDAHTNALRQVRYWHGSWFRISEGSMNVTIVKDEIVSRSSLSSDLFDETARGFVKYEAEEYVDPRPVVTLPEEGCYFIDRETLEIKKK